MRRLMAAWLVLVPFMAGAAAADLSVDQYVQLTKARLELAALEWQERIGSAQQANGDRQTLIAGSQALAAQSATSHAQLLSKFGVTQQAYLRFATDHSREIDSYLVEHADLKQGLDDLGNKIQALIETLDAIVGPVMTRGKGK